MLEITSTKNPKIQHIIKLRQKTKERKASNCSLLEGRNEVEKAINAGIQLRQVFICQEYFQEHFEIKGDSEVYYVHRTVYEKIAIRGDTEGIVAVFDTPDHPIDNLQLPSDPLILLVEKVEKPGNLGAIMRTADACGIDALIICDPLTDLYNPNTIRASLGCIFTIPIAITNLDKSIQFLNEKKVSILAATPHTDKLLYDLDLTGGVAIAVGTEHEGLSDSLMTQANLSCRIPMFGITDSLNVSVSTAVILYEGVRQRRYNAKK